MSMTFRMSSGASTGSKIPHVLRHEKHFISFRKEWRLVKAYISVPQLLSHQCTTKAGCGHPEATLKPSGSQPVGTRKPPSGYPEATPRLPRGYPEATLRLP